MPVGPVRRDRLGRRIGHNWWREYVWDQWHCAYHAWWLEAEAVALGYATELAEYKLEHPTPTFKQFLVELSGVDRLAA